MTDEYRQIHLDALRESKTNPRRHFDTKALDELAASIGVHGVIQPIVVRPINGSETFEVVAGARRYRASKLAGIIDIPARVRELTDEQVLEIQVIENLQREDVHPLDEALGYRTLMDKTQHDVAAIAAKVGKSESYVYQRLKLCDLTPKAQKAFFDDKITAGHAVQIARLQATAQADALEMCTRGFNNSVRDLAHWIEHNVHMVLGKAAFKPDDAQLLPSAGACTNCPRRTGFAPALFPDVKDKDTCTDRACFQAKVAAHIVGVKNNLTARGEKPIEISTSSYTQNKNKPLTSDKWAKVAAADKCEHVRPGVVVEGHDGKPGQVIQICADPTCKKHHGSRQSNMRMSPQEKASQAREALKGKAAAIAREQAIKELLSTVVLGRDTFRIVAKAFAGAIWHEKLKEIAAAQGWTPTKDKNSHSIDYRGAVQKHIATLRDIDLAPFMFELALRTASINGDNYRDTADLHEFAKAHNVDIGALEKTALAELTAKAKQKVDKKKAATKKKPAAKSKSAAKKVQTSAKKKAAS